MAPSAPFAAGRLLLSHELDASYSPTRKTGQKARWTKPGLPIRAPQWGRCRDFGGRGPRVLEQAHASLRPGGRLVLLSLPKDNGTLLPIFQTVLKGIRIIGSIVGTRADLAEVFRLHAAGRTQVLFETRPLADINTSIEDVLASRVPARLVMLP